MNAPLSAERAQEIYEKYRDFTMISPDVYALNLSLCSEEAPETGCIVECGVWRGGMAAGICDVLRGRKVYLFDSFEGLPPATDIDGQAALEWQSRKDEPTYFDNCRAEQHFALRAMSMSQGGSVDLRPGWFKDTVPGFVPEEPIAVLRLDGDWYDSTMVCLEALYPRVMDGGLIIIDDYYAWDGCARAVHDYLSRYGIVDRIRQRGEWFCFMRKQGPRKLPT